MTNTRAIILCLFTVLATLLALYFAGAGYAWQIEGRGLNPIVAYPAAMLCLLAIVAYWAWMLKGAEEEMIRQHFGIDGEFTIDYVSLSRL